jgi:hypothetical protein
MALSKIPDNEPRDEGVSSSWISKCGKFLEPSDEHRYYIGKNRDNFRIKRQDWEKTVDPEDRYILQRLAFWIEEGVWGVSGGGRTVLLYDDEGNELRISLLVEKTKLDGELVYKVRMVLDRKAVIDRPYCPTCVLVELHTTDGPGQRGTYSVYGKHENVHEIMIGYVTGDRQLIKMAVKNF